MSLSHKQIWYALTISIVCVVLCPLASIVFSFGEATSDIWQFYLESKLAEISLNTVWLVVGVSLGAGFLGVSLAGLMVFCDFWGKRHFEWLLILPMAIPTYVLGFVWIGLLDYSAAFPSWLRESMSINLLDFFQIRSRLGITIVMSLAFYPYVYLMARDAFRTQGNSVWEAAKSLGRSPRDIFLRVSLPMARPWILAGLMLVIMETVADFGTVSVFNYDTYTTAIYQSWFGLFSLSTARQLAAVLLVIVFVLLGINKYLKGRRYQYENTGVRRRFSQPFVLRGVPAALCFLYSGFIFGVAFLIPTVQLLIWSSGELATEWQPIYGQLIRNTLLVSLAAAILITFISLILSYTKRISNSRIVNLFVRGGQLGYAIPGTVLAIAVFTSIASLQNLLKSTLGLKIPSLLVVGLLMMLLGYLIRFLAVAVQPVQSAFMRMSKNVEEASTNLGVKGFALIRRVYIPMITGGITTAFLFVFVEVMKEMPITLMTRPFGWSTLSVRIFEMISEGQWERAALPAAILVLIGTLPAYLLIRRDQTSMEL